MVDQAQDMITVPKRYLGDNVVAVNVSEEAFFAEYTEGRYEWIAGVVIEMSPSSDRHQELTHYLLNMLQAYLAIMKVGIVRTEPYTMKTDNTYRQPDLQVIFHDNPHFVEGGRGGPADICIEIVSPESIQRDYGTKFHEYQQVGVKEYWIIDPLRNDARFYRLIEENLYTPIALNENDVYQTPLLPKLKLDVKRLWQDELPDILTVVEMIKSQLNED